MTEHAAVVFVFFFLAEYGSILLMCILSSILFLGGYLTLDLMNLLSSSLEYILGELCNFQAIFISSSSDSNVDVVFRPVRTLEGRELPILSLKNFFFVCEANLYMLKETFWSCAFHLASRMLELLIFSVELFANMVSHPSGINTPWIEGFRYGLSLGLKSFILVFIYIWIRASFPRIRFDQLMTFCWTVLLPILFAFIILVPGVLSSFDVFPINIYLF